MTDKEKTRELIEKRYEYWKEKEFNSHSIESEIRMSECQHLLLMVNSLQEEPVSIWHNASEEPNFKKGPVLVVTLSSDGEYLGSRIYDSKDIAKHIFDYDKWCYLDDILPDESRIK